MYDETEKQSLIKKEKPGTSTGTYGTNNDNVDNATLSHNSSISTEPEDGCAPLPIDQMRSTLSFIQKIGFGLGHIYNDLCAGVWFSYTLLFMQGSLLMSSTQAGALVMLGQVGDALATPIVGILADKFGTKRKWHMAGTGLVFLSFPLIFSLCPWCSTSPIWWPPTYFTATILAFQLGWAIVQITHLAMIPEMSRTRKDRSDLTAIRYSASVCANVVVYIVTWAVLRARNSNSKNIGPADAYRFRDVSLILTLVGLSMAVCFHFSLSLSGYGKRRQQALDNSNKQVTRRRLSDDKSAPAISSSTTTTAVEQPRKNFLKSPLLYQNAFLYVFSRLFCTTALVYIPLWLDERSWTPTSAAAALPQPTRQFTTNVGDDLLLDDEHSVEHIATVPLVSFLASFMASMGMKYTNRLFGHQVSYLIGSVASVAGCLWVALAAPPTASSIRLYGIAILFGAGSSITMISSLCITADMIGRHADQSGFIYSAVTFADKLITGVVVIVIETLKCDKRTDCPEYYKNVLAYACGTAACLGVFTLATLQCNRRRRRRQ